MRRRVCLDLRCLQIGHENRGIGMHARSILENIEADNDFDFFFYAFDKNDPIKHLNIDVKFPYTLVQTPTVKMSINDPRDFFRLLRIIWHRYGPLRTLGIDEFVQFDFTLGAPRWLGTKTTLVAYDLIPLIMRSTYIPGVWRTFFANQGARRIKRSLRAAYYKWRYYMHYKEFARADKIVSISEDTKQSLIERLSIPESKIVTIPLAPVFGNDLEPDTRILKGITKPYLFYVGATDARKRVQDLVAAYNVIRGRGKAATLVLAGGEFKSVEKIPNEQIRNSILESSYREDIHVVGFVSDSEKIALYRNALAFVFPTTHEGFGIPILEAMLQDCPAISYRNSSIPEVAGDAAILVETGDFIAIANQITTLSNVVVREKLINAGRKQAARFTWKSHVRSLLGVLSENSPS